MTTYRFTAPLNLLFVTYLGVAILGGVLFGEDVRFDTDIRPILSDYCYACHGPDSETREAELRLDLREEAMASGLIVPGKPGESELIARVFSNDPDDTMPPPDAPKQLAPEQRELLKRWCCSVRNLHTRSRDDATTSVVPTATPMIHILDIRAIRYSPCFRLDFILDIYPDREIFLVI